MADTWGSNNAWGQNTTSPVNEWDKTAQEAAGGYMSQLQSGQRNAMDEYVRRAALTGVNRGGYGVAGGANQGALMNQDAMRNLASQYASNMGTAMNYGAQAAQVDWQALQNRLQREWQTQERLGNQGWQSGENSLNRNFQTQERLGTQDYQAIQNNLARQLQWNSLIQQLQQQRYNTDIGYMSSLAGKIL